MPKADQLTEEIVMDINDLHDLRDGASARRRRTFNPFVHLSTDTPLMRMLFSITRPGGINDHQPAHKRVARKKVVRAATLPAGSMVSYSKERIEKLKPKP
jgi:hypothetical protein